MGKLPVVAPVGRSLVVRTRLDPDSLNECEAFGHVFAPSTWIFVAEFHVPVDVSIHGPTLPAPPPLKFVVHESTYPTSGEADTFPSPSGISVADTGLPGHALTPEPALEPLAVDLDEVNEADCTVEVAPVAPVVVPVHAHIRSAVDPTATTVS